MNEFVFIINNKLETRVSLGEEKTYETTNQITDFSFYLRCVQFKNFCSVTLVTHSVCLLPYLQSIFEMEFYLQLQL